MRAPLMQLSLAARTRTLCRFGLIHALHRCSGDLRTSEKFPTRFIFGAMQAADHFWIRKGLELGGTREPVARLVRMRRSSGGSLRIPSSEPADSQTGYTRRAVSPAAGMPLQMVDVTLPPKTKVAFPALAYRMLHQQIWVLRGRLRFREGSEIYDMAPGDCLQLEGTADCVFENCSRSKRCRYAVALVVGR